MAVLVNGPYHVLMSGLVLGPATFMVQSQSNQYFPGREKKKTSKKFKLTLLIVIIWQQEEGQKISKNRLSSLTSASCFTSEPHSQLQNGATPVSHRTDSKIKAHEAEMLA